MEIKRKFDATPQVLAKRKAIEEIEGEIRVLQHVIKAPPDADDQCPDLPLEDAKFLLPEKKNQLKKLKRKLKEEKMRNNGVNKNRSWGKNKKEKRKMKKKQGEKEKEEKKIAMEIKKNKMIQFRGMRIKNRIGGTLPVNMRRPLFEIQTLKAQEENVKDCTQPPKCPKKFSTKGEILRNVLKTLPYSGGKSEILLRKNIAVMILKGFTHPSMFHQSASWWEKRVKEFKSYPLGKKHPLTKKFKSIDQRYAKCRSESLRKERGLPPSCHWPHRKVELNKSIEKMNAEAIVKHIEKHTKQFEKIKHLFEGHFSKTCSVFGWNVKDLLILLEQLESSLSLHVSKKELIDEINRDLAKKNGKLKRENRKVIRFGKRMDLRPLKVKHIITALRTHIGSPSLQQSLDYAKVYLACQYLEPSVKSLSMSKEKLSLPKEIDGPSHLLEKYIIEATGENPVVPGIYYYETVLPYYKWLYDIKGSEARKDFYVEMADFFLKHRGKYPIKKSILLESDLPFFRR